MTKHRSASLLLADALAEVERLQIKSQQETINKDPKMVELKRVKDGLLKSVVKLNRQMGITDPNKGWQATINRYQNEIVELTANIDAGANELLGVQEQISEVKRQIHDLESELVNK
tara:strand:- start:166 stop:513 length:348 start_codon:yes stop_codon:yes gene_type:complete